MAFLVATTSLPAVYRPNGYARTTTAGTPHTRANMKKKQLMKYLPGVGPVYWEPDDSLPGIPRDRGSGQAQVVGDSAKSCYW